MRRARRRLKFLQRDSPCDFLFSRLLRKQRRSFISQTFVKLVSEIWSSSAPPNPLLLFWVTKMAWQWVIIRVLTRQLRLIRQKLTPMLIIFCWQFKPFYNCFYKVLMKYGTQIEEVLLLTRVTQPQASLTVSHLKIHFLYNWSSFKVNILLVVFSSPSRENLLSAVFSRARQQGLVWSYWLVFDVDKLSSDIPTIWLTSTELSRVRASGSDPSGESESVTDSLQISSRQRRQNVNCREFGCQSPVGTYQNSFLFIISQNCVISLNILLHYSPHRPSWEYSRISFCEYRIISPPIRALAKFVMIVLMFSMISVTEPASGRRLAGNTDVRQRSCP